MDQRTRFLLGKMVGLLGSDHDGEVVAAARQIKRVLESKGLSFGDLVNLIEGSKSGSVAVREQASGLAAMADSILANVVMMKPQSQFVHDIKMRASSWSGFQMTEKQARWFSFLYAKYG